MRTGLSKRRAVTAFNDSPLRTIPLPRLSLFRLKNIFFRMMLFAGCFLLSPMEALESASTVDCGSIEHFRACRACLPPYLRYTARVVERHDASTDQKRYALSHRKASKPFLP
jgi:hypothetical protein